MCIFARPIDSVTNTQLFARIADKNSQFLVYSMNYQSPERNAIILPIPIARPASEAAVRFIDLSQYPKFFSDLMNNFPEVWYKSASDGSVDSKLQVQEVGNYLATFVPSQADFERLSPLFRLDEGIWRQIPQYKDYGYVVFQLSENQSESHPMAFQFPSAMPHIYFPTFHIHDNQIHDFEEFDHTLFLQDKRLDDAAGDYQNRDILDPQTGFVRSHDPVELHSDIPAAQGVLEPGLLVHHRAFAGRLRNEDMIFDLATVRPAGRYFRWNAWAPWLGLGAPLAVGAAATTWFFARRQRLKSRRVH